MAAQGAAAALVVDFTLQNLGRVVTDLREGARGFESLNRAAEGANDAIGRIRMATSFTGGTAGQVGALGSAFQSLGLTMETMAQTAEGLRERLFTDPLAIGTFGRAVVPAAMGGPQNSAQILAEAIRIL